MVTNGQMIAQFHSLRSDTMITLTSVDEYGVTYAIDTFLTVEDAKDALWQLECYLDEAQTPSRYFQLQDAISDLRSQISEHEDAN